MPEIESTISILLAAGVFILAIPYFAEIGWPKSIFWHMAPYLGILLSMMLNIGNIGLYKAALGFVLCSLFIVPYHIYGWFKFGRIS